MKRCFIELIGGTVLLVGLVLLVLPGPVLPIIAAGLAILAAQFFWARRVMRKAKVALARVRRSSGLRAFLQRRLARTSSPALLQSDWRGQPPPRRSRCASRS